MNNILARDLPVKIFEPVCQGLNFKTLFPFCNHFFWQPLLAKPIKRKSEKKNLHPVVYFPLQRASDIFRKTESGDPLRLPPVNPSTSKLRLEIVVNSRGRGSVLLPPAAKCIKLFKRKKKGLFLAFPTHSHPAACVLVVLRETSPALR